MDESGSLEAHPLFPVSEDSEDEEIKPISHITISRVENGKRYLAPRQRRADEMLSLEQLHAEFGGGEYILMGFYNGRISTQRKINLPGKSKPMFDDGIGSAEEARAVAQAAPAPVDPMAAMMGGSGGGFMPLIMLMMQQQQQAADRQMQMFLAMMENTRSSSAEDKAAARAEMQSNVERERINSERMMAMMQTAMQNKGGDSSGGFTQGVEFMRSFAMMQIEQLKNQKGSDDGPDWGSLIETFGTALQMFSAVKGGGIPGMPGTLPEGIPEAAQ